MIGTAILIGNASCTKALQHFLPDNVTNQSAVSFAGKLAPEQQAGERDDELVREGLDAEQQAAQLAAKRAVKGIARLKVDRAEFDEQARLLQRVNVAYAEATYREDIVARWCPSGVPAGCPTDDPRQRGGRDGRC
jgi:hypothetical protein